MSVKKNLDIYDEKAQKYAPAYEAVKTETALPDFVARLNKITKASKKTALDLACGSGRDAAYIAEQGFKVTAVDGSQQMLAAARKYNPHSNTEYLHDIGPEFNILSKRRQKYDVILLSAFLFHLDKNDREKLYQRLTKLAKPKCYIYISLRYGPSGDDRVMYDVPVKELENFAKQAGFQLTENPRSDDTLGRSAVHWRSVNLNR